MTYDMVRGHGSSSPAAFLIADAPYGEDQKTGYALSGYTDRVLREFCHNSNISYDSLWRTTLIKCPNVDTRKDDEMAAAAREQFHYLVDEINTLCPSLLIPLGEVGFSTLTSLRGIRKFRGSVLLADGTIGLLKPTKVLPILGPYPYMNQEYRLKFISQIDFNKVPKYLHDGPIPDNQTRVWIARSSAALREFLGRSYQPEGLMTFDIETYMGIPTCISFCFDGFESVCVPFMDSSIDLDQRTLMIELVAKALASPIRKVNQNIKYDWKILERWGFTVNNVCGDTMLAASTLYCEFPKNLGFLTSIYTDLPYFKDEGREYDPSKHKRDQFYLYNAKDSLAVHQIYAKQIVEVEEQGVSFVYRNLVELMPIYRRMEDRGIRIDTVRRAELLAKYENLFEIQTLKLRELTGIPHVNPLSSLQMNRLVYDELGYKPLRGAKGTTDEESLEMLMVFGNPERSPTFGPAILQIILDCRKIHKVIEILELPLYPDQRFRCEFNLAGTETGRTSGGKTTDRLLTLDNKGKIKVKNLGHSLQTIGKHGFSIDGTTYGKDVRSMFIPSRGHIFVEIDLSQAEARVDAVLAGNYDILSVFDGPVGIHRLTGSWVFGCDPSEIKKNILVDGVDRYHMAKTVRHAGERNMKAQRLVMMTQRPLRECDKILKTFHEYQPEIRQVFHKDIEAAVKSQRHELRAPNGRLRQFFDRIDSHTLNEAISTLPQGIVSDQTKFSFIPTFNTCPWAHLLMEAHDGALAEVPEGREQEYIEVYKKNVETPIDFRPCTLSRDYVLTIPSEASVGYDWENLKEMK